MRVSASVCSYMAATVIFNLVVVSLMADTNVCGALQYGADLSDFCSQTLETRGWVALLCERLFWVDMWRVPVDLNSHIFNQIFYFIMPGRGL